MHGIVISMDGRGRALDNIFAERLWRNVKQVDVYLKGYATMTELLIGSTKYFVLYNAKRPHQGVNSEQAFMLFGYFSYFLTI